MEKDSNNPKIHFVQVPGNSKGKKRLFKPDSWRQSFYPDCLGLDKSEERKEKN